LTPNQVRWALQKIKEELHPSNENFLNNIDKIKLSLDDTANKRYTILF